MENENGVVHSLKLGRKLKDYECVTLKIIFRSIYLIKFNAKIIVVWMQRRTCAWARLGCSPVSLFLPFAFIQQQR